MNSIAKDYELFLGPYESGFFLHKEASSTERERFAKSLLNIIFGVHGWKFLLPDRIVHTKSFIEKWT